MLDQQPWSEQILNALIQLESDIESAVFDILKNYQAQNKKINNTKIYQAMHSRNFELRNVLESRIMQIATGDKMSISDLLDQCIAHLNKILDNQENMEDILKKMKICYKKVEDTILPPDEKPIQTGSWNWWIEKREWYNKFWLLLNLLREKWIYTDDLYVAIGVNQKNQMREQSYLYIYIPRINKTILINNSYGEKTFIYNWYIQLNYFLGNTKIWIKNNENIVGVNFDYENITNWKSKMNYYLFEKQETDKPLIWEKINVEKFVKRQDFVDFYECLSDEEKNMAIKGAHEYEKLAENYPNIPKTYGWLIPLLWWTVKCWRWWYVEALLKWDEEWKKYYEERKKINSKKIRTREGFLDFYERLSEAERKMVVGSFAKYKELAKTYLNIPKSYEWIISLLWWNNKCLGWWYVEALLKWEEEWKRYYEERKKMKK